MAMAHCDADPSPVTVCRPAHRAGDEEVEDGKPRLQGGGGGLSHLQNMSGAMRYTLAL